MGRKRIEHWTPQSSDVLRAEREHIRAARAKAGASADAPLVGLALSGGGIRSAAFAMGTLQAMVRHDKLDDVDYLSTVSGGGYIGTSLTWWLSQGCGTRAADFPFGVRPGTDTENTLGDRVLNFIRQHAKYLTPGRGLNTISLFAVIMRGVFSAVFVYLQLLIVLMGLLFTLIPAGLQRVGASAAVADRYLLVVAGVTVYVLILGALLYSIFAGTLESPSRRLRLPGYRFFTWSQASAGRLWAVVLALVFLATIPMAHGLLARYAPGWFAMQGSLAANMVRVAGALGAVGTALAGLGKVLQSAQFPAGTGRKLAAKVFGVSFVAFVLIYALLLLAFHVNAYFVRDPVDPADLAGFYAFVAFIAALLGLTVNLNFVGHHRMYRDRLMELFLPDREAVDRIAWKPAKQADGLLLADVETRPYQIVNANVVLVDSNVPRYRGRGGDSFILSPLFSGSTATGWCPTERLKLPDARGMTLPTAMAISGAAVNPDTGAGGQGATRKRLVSALMTLLNVRLGYWTAGAVAPRPLGGSLSRTPNYIFPGIRALFGVGFHENARLIELTDGGHFDNLGLYELIRRRAQVIVVSDAACDPGFRFGDLAAVVERVRTDFGAIVTFRSGADENLDGIVPSLDGTDEETRGLKLAQRGYAVADVAYAKGAGLEESTCGVILYIKGTLIAGLPLDVYDYNRNHAEFPHQTTADQFFDERQFEAYRELGYYITKKAFARYGGEFPS